MQLITPRNVDDRSVLDDMTKHLEGSFFPDKVYILASLLSASKSLFSKLYQRGLKLITGIKPNMKNYLIPLIDKLLLLKPFIIETIFDILKNLINLSHTSHRSHINASRNILAPLSPYHLKSHKPSFSSLFQI